MNTTRPNNEKQTGFLRDTLTTGIIVMALTAVATMGTGCGVFTQDNAVKITGHVSDAAGLSDAQKAELVKLTEQAHRVATGDAPPVKKSGETSADTAKKASQPGTSEAAAPAAAAAAATPKADAADTAGEWIDRIARLVALFGDQNSSGERAEN